MSLITILGIGTFAMAIDYLAKSEEFSSSVSKKSITEDGKPSEPKVSTSDIREIINGVSIKHGERKLEIPYYKDHKHHIFSKRDETNTSKTGGGDNEDMLEQSEVERMKGENKKYSDNAREFKGITTNVVVHNYVTTKENIFRFMKLTVGTFNEALDLYAQRKGLNRSDFLFVYKGGNVMRLLANEFLIELPGTASREINDYYKNYFKRSDADFAIYINPFIPQYETIFSELTYISFLLQDKIREQFVENPTYFFEFEKYNEEAKRNILAELLDSLNKADSLAKEENDDYYGAKFVSVNHRGMTICKGEDNEIKEDSSCPGDYSIVGKKDSLVEFAEVNDDGEKETVVYNISDKTNYIYVQYNTALQFSDAANFQRHFNLTRTKINFNATYVNKNGKQITSSYGGELIDVSLAHRNSSGVEHFWEHQNDFLREYTLKYNDDSITFNAYSIAYIVEDLEDVIYKQSDRPWKDKKYKKRVNRTFYFYFLDLFDKIPSNLERIELLTQLYNVVYRISTGENSEIILKSLDSLYTKMDSKNLLMKELITQIIRLYKIQQEDGSEKEAFKAYNDVLIANLETIINGFKQTAEFCSVSKGKFDEEKLYNTNVDSLAGGSSRNKKSHKSSHSRRHGSKRSSCNCRKCRK